MTATKGEASHFKKLLCVMATISYCRKVFINKDCDKFSLLLGEAQLCLPYVCLLKKIAFS